MTNTDDTMKIHPRHIPVRTAATELLCFIHDMEEKHALTVAECLAILADVMHTRVWSCVKAERGG